MDSDLPPLQSLHSVEALIRLKLEQYQRLSEEELINSLRPGQPGSLKTRPEGTIIDGHHRVKILRERGYNVDSLPREVLPKDSISDLS